MYDHVREAVTSTQCSGEFAEAPHSQRAGAGSENAEPAEDQRLTFLFQGCEGPLHM